MIETSDKPLTLTDYQAGALRTDQGTDDKSQTFLLLGLFGEVGSLLSEVKKKQRDKIAYLGYAEAVEEELGDVLWYFTVFAARAGTSLAEIAAETIVPAEDKSLLDFTMTQPDLPAANDEPTPSFETTLLHLAGAVGALITGFQSGKFATDRPALKAVLTEIFQTLVKAADEASVSLNGAARHNLDKTANRWPKEKIYPRPFDVSVVR